MLVFSSMGSMDLKSKFKQYETGIAFNLAFSANRILTESARKNIRAKKNEAKLRLEDHLKRFPDCDWQNNE